MLILYSFGLILCISTLILIVRKIYSTAEITNMKNDYNYKIVNNDIKEYLLTTV
jgi:hypothetical protein